MTSRGDASSYVWTSEGTLLFSAARDQADQKKMAEEAWSVFYEIDPWGGEAQRAFGLPVKNARLHSLENGGYLVEAVQENQVKGKDEEWSRIYRGKAKPTVSISEGDRGAHGAD